MAKSKKALIICFGLALLFLILFFTLFFVMNSLKSNYDAALVSSVSISVSNSRGESSASAAGTSYVIDQGAISSVEATISTLNASYTGVSISCYVCSILAIICVGFGLWLSDRLKTKEESAYLHEEPPTFELKDEGEPEEGTPSEK